MTAINLELAPSMPPVETCALTTAFFSTVRFRRETGPVRSDFRAIGVTMKHEYSHRDNVPGVSFIGLIDLVLRARNPRRRNCHDKQLIGRFGLYRRHLFGPQRNERINLRGPARRNKAAEQRNDQKHERDAAKDRQVR